MANIHDHEIRNSEQINIPYCRLHKTSTNFSVMGMKLYNKLPSQYYKSPTNSFKARFYNWLLINPFYSVDEFLNINSHENCFISKVIYIASI